jgi:hypothetical protein
MTFIFPDEWRQEIKKKGTPFYVEAENGERYVLLEIIVEADEAGGYRAHPNKLFIYGKGKTKRTAMNDLHKKFCTLLKFLSSPPHAFSKP